MKKELIIRRLLFRNGVLYLKYEKSDERSV